MAPSIQQRILRCPTCTQPLKDTTVNRNDLQNYFKNLTLFDKLIWAVAGLLLLKWMLGPVSSYDGGQYRTVGFRLTGGTALWGVLLYSGAFLAIRLGLLKSFVSDKRALFILFGLCSFFILVTAFVLEQSNAQVQFLLSLAVVGLQVYAYRHWASHYQLSITTPDTSAPDSKYP